MKKSGILYVVALPIGNLKDITLRALEVLKSVKYVVCEDTRTFKKLVNHYQLGEKKLISLYKNVEKERSEKIINILESGENVALVSEAGTPGISDPGAYLINLSYEKGIKIVPIPGVSALTCALSVSGANLNRGFIFLGFLPRKKAEQKKVFENLPKDLPIIIFEAPHRFAKTLKNLLEILGNRRCFLARELTKMHEELLWSDLKELSERKEFLGEITLIIMPENEEFAQEINLSKIKNEAESLKAQGLKRKEIAKILAKKYNLSAKFLYELISEKSKE